MKKTFRYQMTLIAIISCLCFGGCGLSTSDVESTTTDYAADVTEFDEETTKMVRIGLLQESFLIMEP